jgi:hypothetical protein
LSRISLQYCRAIRSLRKAGWEIANRVVIENGKRHGYYRLGSRRCPADSKPEPAPIDADPTTLDDPPTKAEHFPQFGDLAPDRTYRE